MMVYLRDIVTGMEMAQGDEMIRKHSKAASDDLWQGSYSRYHSISEYCSQDAYSHAAIM